MGQFNFPTVDILSLRQDDYGLCAKVRVHFQGISTLVRWGLDEFTYRNLRDCLESHVSLYPTPTLVQKVEEEGVGRIRLTSLGNCVGEDIYTNEDCFVAQGFFLDDYQDAPFRCSRMFAANLVWLSQIKSNRDLNSILWDKPKQEIKHDLEREFQRESMQEFTQEFIPVASELPEDEIPDEHGILATHNEVAAMTNDLVPTQNANVTVADNNSEWHQPRHPERPISGRGQRIALQYGIAVATILIVATVAYATIRDGATNAIAGKQGLGSSPPLVAAHVLNTANTSANQKSLNNSVKENSSATNVPSQHVLSAAPATSSTQNAVTVAQESGSSHYMALSNPKSSSKGANTCQSNATRPREFWEVPKGEVALTFDDGPTPLTSEFVKVLNQYGVHATFFFVGQKVQDWPDSVKFAAASGEVIGDHSMTHPDLTDLSESLQEQQIINDKTLLEQLTKVKVTLFRPPYEAYNASTDEVLVSNGMALALWNRDPRDWAAKTSEEVIQAVLGSQPSGGLYDMHETDVTLAALPTIIEKLKAMHLKFVTLPTVSSPAKTGSGGV